MADEPHQPAGPPWPAWSLLERRVLGVLVEKQKTTPDIYPLSLNALTTGCNQKSNRDPILDLSDVVVEDTLVGLQKAGLAIRISGGRVEKWRHNLYDAWRVSKAEMAILAELLLRGPQTEGELRSRVQRMEPIDDLDQLRVLLQPLAERQLVIYLSPPGRRGTMLTHGFHPVEELDRLREKWQEGGSEASVTAAPTAALPARGPSYEARLAALEATVAELVEQVRQLKELIE
ncbi:MAG: YceH family protein [Gemmataceae bacterium]